MSEPFVGEIRMFAGNFAPRSWAFCDGQLLAVSQNDALFSLLGTIYGGDGRTTFALPDLRGRIPVHAGSGPGLSARALGARGGQERVTLTTASMPAHRHSLMASSGAASDSQPGGRAVGVAAGGNVYGGGGALGSMGGNALSTQSGGAGPHDNMQPFLCINFIIALFGIYPSRS